VTKNIVANEQFWKSFYGPNIGYLEEQFDLYKRDPQAVDQSLQQMFEKYGPPSWIKESEISEPKSHESVDVKKLTSAMKLVEAIRRYAHLQADIYPVGSRKKIVDSIYPEAHGLTNEDLQSIVARDLWEEAPSYLENGLDVVEYLTDCYTGTISYEYDHVHKLAERKWLMEQIEINAKKITFAEENQKQLLDRLIEVESFENFLQRTFVGQKRFSIEGLEMMVPMLDQIVKHVTEDKIDNIMMGMAHRGRLSVLAHVLGKPIDLIFSEFHHSPDKELVPSEGSTGINYGWTGDVKYHFGATREVKFSDESSTRITLAHNPSHLEFVNPVVAGSTRAVQDDRSKRGYSDQQMDKGCSILIHGDAAFIGEGIVAETLNLSGLEGYRTGGTIHLIANNLVGYTTNQDEGRSTRYASDLAKGFEIPIIHVNADDPEACIKAIKFAYEYRKKFHKDIVIDLVGYRRYGHNEMDEPRATQPLLYQEIDNHPTVTEVYAKRLNEAGIVQENHVESMEKISADKLQKLYESLKENETVNEEVKEMPEVLSENIDRFETAVALDTLQKLNKNMLKRPEHFNRFKRLDRVFKRREKIFEAGNKIDWGVGEALAYASILRDGIPIRLTGQDSERGTFAHRHMVLHDVETSDKYCIMHGIPEAKASFDIHNSPLSEAAVLGFEYGYSIESPDTLVIWEAQFGDFANAAQVIFDQFISSARAKWGEKSNMVVLLPHGYEGQGPEHSSARLERFLQMAAENNWIIANVTSSAQFFHLIRRQAAMRGRMIARPLILMTPKSLLRNERVSSVAKDFYEGHFYPLKSQPNLEISEEKVTRLIVGSGKIMVDIEEAIANSEQSYDFLAAYRLEQIYPFPKKDLQEVIERFPSLEEIVWVQEEPKNMGAWNFIRDYFQEIKGDNHVLEYIGRPRRSATSVGEPNIHRTIQSQIVNQVVQPNKGGN